MNEPVDVQDSPAVRLPSGIVLQGKPGQSAEEIAAPHFRAAVSGGQCPHHGEPLTAQDGYCETCRGHWRLAGSGWDFRPDAAGLVRRASLASRGQRWPDGDPLSR